ncbi:MULTISPECIES: ABC transporter substrate-binding protein [unclassified Streptomyces]|uniref:ABC transporter substrate-binding protein n=1 Tax=unclassified Streptomyces TaxID=2593676 RepID=UPI00278C239C|nr:MULTISPECIES: ABC transporter substrate-binding protein [unclassified Streptomyces]
MSASRRTFMGALFGAGAGVALSGCGGVDMTKQTSPYANAAGAKTVTISVQSWVGASANSYVAKYLLEEKLGYRVDIVQVDEVPAWDALSQGRVDAIMEDWGHPDQEQLYVKEKKTIVSGGGLGVIGHIGWFVPTYYAEKNPDITDWRNLNKYAKEFATAESGGKGQLLDGSPSYFTYDKALVKNLDLDFQVVFAGSEAAQLTQVKQFAKVRKPFMMYLNRPHWFFSQVPMTEVKLPKYTEGCEDDADAVRCAYPTLELQKYLNADFAGTGSDAARFLRNFRWTGTQQSQVSLLIAGKGLTPDEAAKRWVAENRKVWQRWMPSR